MDDKSKIKPFTEDTFFPVTLLRWEDDVIYDPEEARLKLIEEYTEEYKSGKLPKCGFIPTQSFTTLAEFNAAWKSGEFVNMFKAPGEPLVPIKPILDVEKLLGPDPAHSIFPKDNYELEHYRWEDDVIYDPDNMPKNPAPRLLTLEYEDDPLLFGIPEDKHLDEVQNDEVNTSHSSFDRKERKIVHCKACGAEGHMRNNKNCPMYKPVDERSASSRASLKGNTNLACRACGAEGHNRSNKKCPFFGNRNHSRASIQPNEPNAKKIRREKRPKDAPKPPKLAYHFFTNHTYASIKKQTPGLSHNEIRSIIGKLWKSSSAEEKAPYEEMRQLEMEKYNKAMEVYNAGKSDLEKVLAEELGEWVDDEMEIGSDYDFTEMLEEGELDDPEPGPSNRKSIFYD